MFMVDKKLEIFINMYRVWYMGIMKYYLIKREKFLTYVVIRILKKNVYYKVYVNRYIYRIRSSVCE